MKLDRDLTELGGLRGNSLEWNSLRISNDRKVASSHVTTMATTVAGAANVDTSSPSRAQQDDDDDEPQQVF